MAAIINLDNFPAQSPLLGKAVDVSFEHGRSARVAATLVRCDIEPPFITIVKLYDGRHVLATECFIGLPSLV
jgi:hypothetical protein